MDFYSLLGTFQKNYLMLLKSLGIPHILHIYRAYKCAQICFLSEIIKTANRNDSVFGSELRT